MYKILLIGLGLFILQALLTYIQIKTCDKKIKEMRRKGTVGMGAVKGKMKAGNIIILACDEEGYISDACIMQGITVFARFKPIKDIYNKHIGELKEKYNRQGENGTNKSMIQALQMIEEKLYTEIN